MFALGINDKLFSSEMWAFPIMYKLSYRKNGVIKPHSLRVISRIIFFLDKVILPKHPTLRLPICEIFQLFRSLVYFILPSIRKVSCIGGR